MEHEPVPRETEDTAKAVVDAAFRVHTALGPGLLESVYEECLAHELSKRKLKYRKQESFPVVYDGVRIGTGLRLDLLVEDRVVVELKAVDQIAPVHMSQMLTYLKLTGKRLGLLINFNTVQIKDGIKRVVL